MAVWADAWAGRDASGKWSLAASARATHSMRAPRRRGCASDAPGGKLCAQPGARDDSKPTRVTRDDLESAVAADDDESGNEGPVARREPDVPDVRTEPPRRRRMPHAIVMMMLIITGAVLLTWFVPSGAYQRGDDGLVVPGSFQPIPKDYSLFEGKGKGEGEGEVARPVSPIAIFSSVPAGMAGAAPLIFMILFIGGMFGVLRRTGALDAGLDRLLALTKGDVLLLAPILMVALSAGSTFLGLISEYLVVIPLVVALARRIGLDNLAGLAIVAVAAKIGYMTSVTNPLPLVIAQPIVGVPMFSGTWLRFVAFALFLAIGIVYLLRTVGRRTRAEATSHAAPPLERSHLLVLGVVVALVGAIVYGARELGWGNLELGAVYLFAAFAIALLARMPSRQAAEAFLGGMNGMMLAAILVGLAKAVEIVLRDGLILDSIIHALAGAAQGHHPVLVAQSMVLVQMLLDVLIPSTSGQAAVTMPILGPIAQLSGVSGQTAVLAFIFGNGLTNMITPTSGMLLAYLATADVSYGRWVRFAFPLFAILAVLALAIVGVAVVIGY